MADLKTNLLGSRVSWNIGAVPMPPPTTAIFL